MVDKLPKKIKKRLADTIDDVMHEIEWITEHITKPEFSMVLSARYNLHSVTMNGEQYLATDAKVINRALHQTGRGNFRHIITKDAVYVGVAEHRNNGSYKWVK